LAAARATRRNSDCELMLAMAAGDADALRTLSARYSRMLTGHAWRVLGDPADAQEVAADVLWQAWCESASFRPQRGAVATWLFTLVRSRAIDRLRAKRAYQNHNCDLVVLDGAMVKDNPPDPAVEIDRAQRARIIRTAIAGLETSERTVLELTYFSDLSQQQIAEQLGLPLGTVKTRIRTAITRLRQTLVALKGEAGNRVTMNGSAGPRTARLPGALHRDHE
jgi:RNA polymerase sigma-70 factor, ECF subfamily